MTRGVSVIEIVIVLAIIGILAFVFMGYRQGDATDEEYCQKFGSSTVQNMPAKCLKFFSANGH